MTLRSKKIESLSATNMRAVAKEHYDAALERTVIYYLEVIERAAKQGKTSKTLYNIPEHLWSDLQDKLIGLGYQAEKPYYAYAMLGGSPTVTDQMYVSWEQQVEVVCGE